MKLKNIVQYLIIGFLTIQLFSACANDTDAEPKFDKTPAERLNEQKSELNTALLSSEFGWKAVYFTDDTQLGGYTHLIKFLPNNKVEMASDFNSDTKVYTSEYSVVLGSTMSLLFNTYNRIHLLSDSNSFPIPALRGKGYLGDFQFLYYGQENGDLVFRSNRLVREVRFVKATAQDWTDLPKNLATEKNVIGASTRPLFRSLEVNDGAKVTRYDFSFTTATRYAVSRAVDGSESVISMGVGYTPTGIVVSPAVTVAGQKLSAFTYNDTDGSFTATGTGGVTATIKYGNQPLALTDDYKILLPANSNLVYGHDRSILTLASTNSASFLALFRAVEASRPAGTTLSRVQPWFNTPNGSYVEYRFTSATGVITRVYHFFTLSADQTKKIIYLTPTTKWTSGSTFAAAVDIPAPAYLKDLDDQIMNPGGLYFKRESFTVGATNPVFTFTSASGPFRFTTWAFQ
ncbi:DUF4302 domain-containing protein [Flavobacterium sp. N502536]|uniref:DUF4302 domain-containing protein n=1 Tax=Flavobacterium sp. N502536 TaxID=2986837 RepID=UPI002223A526|nr:DUF4302 domain-containing protein [Flavobacterium sp. N502536]